MTDRPTLAETQADQFWARDPVAIHPGYELRVDVNTAGIYDTATGRQWTGDYETIAEEWADITHQEGEPMATTTTPITIPDALERLHLLYKVATTTAAKRGRDGEHYIELADDLHETVNSILRGIDPDLAIADLVKIWRDNASLMDDHRLALLNLSWANMAQHGGNPKPIGYGPIGDRWQQYRIRDELSALGHTAPSNATVSELKALVEGLAGHGSNPETTT